MRLKLAVFAALALGVIIAPRPVIAQEAALEEIIVTARKREESVQDIPIAVSAFTADDIRANWALLPLMISPSTPRAFLSIPPSGVSLRWTGLPYAVRRPSSTA